MKKTPKQSGFLWDDKPQEPRGKVKPEPSGFLFYLMGEIPITKIK